MTDDRTVSCAQKRLWILDRLDAGSTAYIVPLLHWIDGDLDVGVLARSLTEIVRRHEVLRTVYRLRSRAVRQVVRPAKDVRVPVVDVSGHKDPQTEAERLAAAEARRPFDLSTDLMLRALLVRLSADRHLLCLTFHHIACDGWSMSVLHHELSACYRSWSAGGSPGLPPLREQYADFAEAQQTRLAGSSLQTEWRYWRERLAALPASVTVPADRPREPVPTFAGRCARFTVDPPVARCVEGLARAARATPFAVFLAALAVLTRAEGGGPEAVIGTPVSNRRSEDHYRLVGMFVNTVVQRLEVPAELAFRDLVHRARDETRAALAHADLPFEMLVEELNPVRRPGVNPLFQIVLGYQEGEPAGLVLPGCTTSTEYGDTSTAKLDLSLSVHRAAGRYSIRLECRGDLYGPASVRRLAERFGAILAAATADPRVTVAGLC